MLALFFATGYAGFLGWQWRRVRTIQDEITELKKQVPVAAEGQTIASPVEGQIKELTEVTYMNSNLFILIFHHQFWIEFMPPTCHNVINCRILATHLNLPNWY